MSDGTEERSPETGPVRRPCRAEPVAAKPKRTNLAFRRVALRIIKRIDKTRREILEDNKFLAFPRPPLERLPKRVKEPQKQGDARPLNRTDSIVILSYEFAARLEAELRTIPWDLVVFDEAHKLRNVFKAADTSRAALLRAALKDRPKLLLTATPLQNNLMELYGLVSVLDEHFFGSPEGFKAESANGCDDAATLTVLGTRLQPICKRTLRRQVQKAGLINYTNRMLASANSRRASWTRRWL